MVYIYFTFLDLLREYHYIALDSAPVSTSTTLAGAAGVAAERFLDFLLLLERRFGVLERREAERLAERVRREVERRFDFLERREERRFGVRERRAERLEVDFDRETDRRRLPLRFFGALGVTARLAARRRRVVARRSAARRLELFGVRDLRELFFFFGVRERVELREEALEEDFLGALGDLARRTERRFDADRDVETEREEERRLVPFGALALRRAALRRLSDVRGRRFGAFGVLARRADRRREDFRELDLFTFFAFFPSLSSSFRALFFLSLIPISLFLLATIIVLYSFFSLM